MRLNSTFSRSNTHRIPGLRMCQSLPGKHIPFTLSALLALGQSLAIAHIIPPENLHPVAEAYQRSAFILNLHPVDWERVKGDLETIANYWNEIAPAEGEPFNRQLKKDLENSDQREVFQTLTRSVSALCRQHIGVAGDLFATPQAAYKEVENARGVFDSFSEVLRAVDAKGYYHLGQSWLGMINALGSPGLLGVGVVEANRDDFQRAARQVSDYLSTNFGEGFIPPAGKKLAPRPIRSPTYNASAQLPFKLPPGSNINKQIPRPRQILNMTSRGVDEATTPLIAVGDMAFDSAFIYGNPMRSIGMTCNNCHNKSITNPNFMIPGLSGRKGGMDVTNSFFAPHANNGHFDPLDIPDLRGIRFTAPYGRNGRFSSLHEFIRNVIVNEFNGPEPDPVILDGLVAYIIEFDFLPNKHLQKDGRLAETAPQTAKRGEMIFNKPFSRMGGMSCASCHIPSANFVDHKRHDIGTVAGYAENSRDRAMDTPTLLGILWSPPYFHDGSQPTLRSVVDWFDGAYGLNLDNNEKEDLTAYLETVGDGTDPYEDTPYYLDAEMEEFYFFLSAYEFLQEKNEQGSINLTFQTVALEIRNHKWELQDSQYRPILERLAEIMDEALAANREGNVEEVRTKVGEYRALYAKNVEVLK